MRAMVLLRMGKVDDAVEILEDGIANCPRPLQREYFSTALAVALLKREAYIDAQNMLEKIDLPLLRTQINVLKFHASGALGDIVRATESSEKLSSAKSLPFHISEVGAELRRRYLEKLAPLHSDEWLVEKEIDLLLSA